MMTRLQKRKMASAEKGPAMGSRLGWALSLPSPVEGAFAPSTAAAQTTSDL